jgi:MFS family permease
MALMEGRMVTDEAPLPAAPPRPLWRNGDFLLLWSGQAVSTLGSTISTLALPLLVLALTRSPAQAGFIAAAQAIPYIVLGLPAGALVDRWDRKAVMIRCDLARALALGSVPLAALWGRLTLAQLYGVALVTGTALVFFNIAQTAALTRVVSGEQLPRATALDRTADSVAALVGPGVGGVLISLARSTLTGAALAFLVDSLSYLASTLSLLLIGLPFQAQRAPVAERTLRGEIAEGLEFLWTHRRIRALALVSMAATLFFSPLSLVIIVLAQQRLHADARTIGLIFSIGSGGAVLGAIVAPALKARLRVGVVVIGTVAIEALSTGLLAVAPSPVLLVLGWAVHQPGRPHLQCDRPVLSPDAHSRRLARARHRCLPAAKQRRSPSRPRGRRPAFGICRPRPVLWIMAGGGMLIALAVSFTELRQA